MTKETKGGKPRVDKDKKAADEKKRRKGKKRCLGYMPGFGFKELVPDPFNTEI